VDFIGTLSLHLFLPLLYCNTYSPSVFSFQREKGQNILDDNSEPHVPLVSRSTHRYWGFLCLPTLEGVIFFLLLTEFSLPVSEFK